ncbi:hypothetical protein T01_2563 [Trichinella spiralis]|uniref:Uncharacterized protein n=1 Tax=Trichinella spiralis TaxID=6334 RepID=A0A0V1B8M7_TRISP|nr:hypothetical protein T01_2563 [Trichinella spiralis]
MRIHEKNRKERSVRSTGTSTAPRRLLVVVVGLTNPIRDAFVEDVRQQQQLQRCSYSLASPTD